MKKIPIIVILFFFFISVLKAEEVVSGMVYRKDILTPKQYIHVLEIDPGKLTIIAAHAKGTARARESLEDLAKRHNAIAAINGGFFRRGIDTNGLPAGVLKIKGQWYGLAYQKRAAIGWSSNDRTVLIDRIQTKTTVTFNQTTYPINILNQPGAAKQSILYTAAYGDYTDPATTGMDIVIDQDKVTAIQPAGKVQIPKQGYVYRIGSKYKSRLKGIKIDDPANVHIYVAPKNQTENTLWQQVDNIIGGAPLLIYQNRKIQNYAEERIRSDFITLPHARTAVGILPNGHWVFVVVENNIFKGTLGLTIPELATYMQKLGCVYALNLDGGGSSTLFINNQVVNHPQGDIDEDYGISTARPISDAILILSK